MSTGDPARRRRPRRDPFGGPPNTSYIGRPVEVPPGVIAWPGPRRLLRDGRRYLHVRIHPLDLGLWGATRWVATVLCELPDCGIVAEGDDPTALKSYLLDRFPRSWYKIYGDGTTPTISTHDDPTGDPTCR